MSAKAVIPYLADAPKLASIRTPFNRREAKSTLDTRRVLRNGRWVRQDPQGAKVIAWLRS